MNKAFKRNKKFYQKRKQERYLVMDRALRDIYYDDKYINDKYIGSKNNIIDTLIYK